MQTIRRSSLAALVLLSVFLASCATTQVQRARQVSVSVHATLAAVDDAESALFKSGAVPAWTEDKHKAFSARLIVALKAGKSLNEAVRVVPLTGQAKADLQIVSTELRVLSEFVESVLPPDNKVRITLGKAMEAVLAVLPIFLE